jgi:hypothetical protein
MELEAFAERFAPQPRTYAAAGGAFRLLDQLEVDHYRAVGLNKTTPQGSAWWRST